MSEVGPNKIIEVYLINETKVKQSIKKQRRRNPDGSIGYYRDYQDVHIVQKSTGFELLYGCRRKGTGPFKTLEKAESWFLNQGR